MVNFFGFPAEMCRPAPHRERRASLVSEKRDGEVGASFGRLERTPAFPRGGGGRAKRAQSRGGALGPRPCFGCRKSGLRHFFEVFIAPLRLRRDQGAMQRNPCYARLFADLPYTLPNPIIASGGCGPRTPKGFSTGLGTAKFAVPLALRRA